MVVFDDEDAALAQKRRGVRAELAQDGEVVRRVWRVEVDYVPGLGAGAPLLPLVAPRAAEVLAASLWTTSVISWHSEQVEFSSTNPKICGTRSTKVTKARRATALETMAPCRRRGLRSARRRGAARAR